MAKGKGAQCPHCSTQTFHDKGSYRLCSQCGYVGWSWRHSVKATGKGEGNQCPNCEKQTLHRILKLSGGQTVRRCGICDFSAIEPPEEEA